MLQLVSTIREFREFLAAKKRKREPLRWKATGAAEASYVPRRAQGFANFRSALRERDFGQASERIEALAAALRRRHGCELPLPRKVMQNSDYSVSMFFEGLLVRAFPDGVQSLIGGAQGRPVRGVANEVLDLLAFQARIQGPR
jgi:hypothetical protein